MEQLSFKLDVFEGPLDLLLHLISKNKVNIYDIPINEITNQYLEAIDEMKKLDLEVSSEFIVMAAQLIYIKSKMLLPAQNDDEEEDPRADLASRLIEYKRYKEASIYLKEHEFSSRYMFFKKPDDVEPKVVEAPITFDLSELTSAFYDILERAKRREPPPKQIFDGIVKRSVVSVKDKISNILDLVCRKKKVSFKKYFSSMVYRDEMVAAFLAVLELIKDGRLCVDYTNDKNDFEITAANENAALTYSGEDEYE